MESFLKFLGIAVFIFAQLFSPSTCTDRMFVAEAENATIVMAEAIEYSFINATFSKVPLIGLVFPIGVEFDHRTELIYWTDAVLHTVNRAALDGSSQEVLAQLQNIPGDYKYPHGIALNVDDDKVYWTDGYLDVIEYANLDGTNRMVLLTTGFNAFPVGIVYSSFRRKIFWTDRGQHPKLEMANPDGTERVTLIDGDIDSNFTHPTGLALDASEQRLYWTDTTVDRIENLNLDNMNRFVNFWITNSTTDIHPYGVARYFEDIYFSDQLYDDVYAIDFPVGNIILVKDGLPTPAEIHIDADTSCPQSNLCAATGKCIITRRQPNHGFVCVCDAGYTGTHCEIDIDDCDPHPCLNGGICTDGPNSFTCTCAAGYSDNICSTDIDDCDSIPCLNEGTCTDGVNSFTCTCAAGYTDSTCSTNIDDCVSNPCTNEGTCTDGIDSFACTCAAGYTGRTCSSEIDYCSPHPCGKWESCRNTDENSFICTAVDRCFPDDPCGVNEECSNAESTDVGYHCNCSEGYERRGSVCMDSMTVGGSVGFTTLNGEAATFTNALNDPTSEVYQKFERLCHKIINEVISKSMTTTDDEWEVDITGFREGSIVVDFEVTVFNPDRSILNDQAAAVETSLEQQPLGVWRSDDGSVNLYVESVTAVGEICLTFPCSNGMCVTTAGDLNYRCICNYGYTGQHCETEVTCALPNHPLSHVKMPASSYRGGDFITIECDEKEVSVLWQCNGTSGEWTRLADLDCKDDEGGLPTGAIIGAVVGAVLILLIGMILCFFYKMANRKRKRPSTTDGLQLSERRMQQAAGCQGLDNEGGNFMGVCTTDALPSLNRHLDRTGTLPVPPLRFAPPEHKEPPTPVPGDLPPAYDYLRSEECSGSHYEAIIHVDTGKPEVETPSPMINRNEYLSFST